MQGLGMTQNKPRSRPEPT